MFINVSKPVSRDTDVMVQMFQEEKDEFKIYGRPLKHNLCSYINTDKLLYPGFQKYGTLPKKCPVGPMRIEIINYKMSLENFPVGLSQGKWKLNFSLYNKKTQIVEIFWIFKVVEQ